MSSKLNDIDSNFANSLLRELEKSRKNGYFCDLILMSDKNEPVLCHSLIFRICCDGMSWKSRLNDLLLTKEQLENLLSFIYTGKLHCDVKNFKKLEVILKELKLKKHFFQIFSEKCINKVNSFQNEMTTEIEIKENNLSEQSKINDNMEAEIIHVSLKDYAPPELFTSTKNKVLSETEKKYRILCEDLDTEDNIFDINLFSNGSNFNPCKFKRGYEITKTIKNKNGIEKMVKKFCCKFCDVNEKTLNLIIMHLKNCNKNPRNRCIIDGIQVEASDQIISNEDEGDPFLWNSKKSQLETISCGMCSTKFNVNEVEENFHIHMYNEHKVDLPDELKHLLQEFYCSECDQYININSGKHFEAHKKISTNICLKYPNRISCDFPSCFDNKMLSKLESIKHFREIHGLDQTENTMCSKEYLLKCNYCSDFATYSEVLYTIHLTNKHKYLPMYPLHKSIRFCPVDNCFIIGLKCHIESHLAEIHEEDNNILCKYCDELFTSKKNMNQHINENHRDDLLNDLPTCEDCGQIFKYNISLFVHENRFHLPSGDLSIEPFYCNDCKQVFNKYANYQIHKYNQHKYPIPNDLKLELKDYYCNVCDIYLKKSSKNCLHQKTLTPNTFFCDKCGKECNSQLSFSIHYQRAHKAKQFKCKFHGCVHKSNNKADLEMHLKLYHHGSQPNKFQCTVCEKHFNEQYILNRHLRTKHSQMNKINRSRRGRPPKLNANIL